MKIQFEKYTLKNGLRVILAPDNAVPVVTVYMAYGVGARSEEKGRTGFAHLFEHMMFQGSANAPKGMHFELVESNGGVLNGSTHPDYTDYFQTLPSNKLPVALWLEADRMRALAITKDNLDNQKEAVKQERRLRFDNQPYATAIVDVFPQLAFQNWSSAHSLIGSFEDLDAATVEDVRKFYRTYYAPNNAVLAIAGDIRSKQARQWVEQYFGSIELQPQPPAPDLSEPLQQEPRWKTYRDRLARVPMVVVGYPGPKRRSADYTALVMLDVILTAGESSRLYQALVKEKRSVLGMEASLGWPFARPSDYRDPGVYALSLPHNPAFTAQQIVAQLEEEFERLKREPPGLEEMNRARTTLRLDRISSLQSTMTRASLLAQYELFDNNPDYLNTELDAFLSVTPSQVRDVAEKYLVKARQTVLEIVPASKEEK